MEMGTEAEQLSNGAATQDHKRAEDGHEIVGGEVKRPREGRDDNDDGGGGHLECMDEDEVYSGPEMNYLESYRQEWIRIYGKTRGSFEDQTEIPAMLHTLGPILPSSACPRDMLQIFSVKVMEIMGSLSWPLGVYGHVAVRDALDHKRNYIFRRQRENCQTLTSPEDSCLKLTGPSRAVVLINPVYFEVDLKVKSNGTPFDCEDKILSYNVFLYSNVSHIGDTGYARTEVDSTEDSTIGYVIAHLRNAVEATVEVHVAQGSTDFKARFTARTAGIDEDVVLLDSLDSNVVVAEDGLVTLDRRVVSVEEKVSVEVEEEEDREGFLSFLVEATKGGGDSAVKKKLTLRTRLALKTQEFLDLGFCKLSVVVGWSMID